MAPFQINVAIDTKGLDTRTARGEKRLAYNTAEALNNTGKAAQGAMRVRMEAIMKLRSETKRNRKWLLERIKLQFASARKGTVYCELYIDNKNRLLLGAFETGEMREPFVGKNLAEPNPLQAREGGTFGGAIKPDLTFKALKFKKVSVMPGKFGYRSQFKGLERTFILKATTANPLGGVYQRVGPGKDDIRLVYGFRRAFQLKKILHMLQTAEVTMRDKFAVEFAIANARNPSL